jgi:hypothetical protein
MKTQSIELFPLVRRESSAAGIALPRVRSAIGLTTRILLAMVPALALVTGTAWVVTLPDVVPYAQASLWALGFVFLGLAVESDRSDTALLLSVTGIALPLLAWLSSRVAVELAIVAATLVALWILGALVRR